MPTSHVLLPQLLDPTHPNKTSTSPLNDDAGGLSWEEPDPCSHCCTELKASLNKARVFDCCFTLLVFSMGTIKSEYVEQWDNEKQMVLLYGNAKSDSPPTCYRKNKKKKMY